MSVFDKLKKCEWIIAIRKRSKDLLFEKEGTNDIFVVCKNTFRYWCADPFLIDYKDKKYLFFELYDRLKRKGIIGYRLINKEGKLSRIYKAFETNAHLSYPFVYIKNGLIYMIPESNNLNELILLEGYFTDRGVLKFKKKTTIINLPLADSTFFKFNNNFICLTTPVTNKSNVDLLCGYIIENEEMKSFNHNPIVNDKSKARMAGKIIYHKDKIIRPSQNCTSTYGGGLVFSEIIQCDLNHYEEKIITRINSMDIKLSRKNVWKDGIHTYNYDKDYEVIDLKKNAQFSFIECIGFVLEKCKIVRKRKRI